MKHFFSKIRRIALLQAVALGGFFAISTTVQAEMPVQPKPIWADPYAHIDGETLAKDARRDPNKYCVDCHGHLSKFEHKGKHFQKETVSPNNGQPLNCVSCHGNISENHRKGVKDVMRFNAHGKAKNPALERSVAEQNQVCFACHSPEKLRETFWAHDTHAAKISCTNCHMIHPEKEAMKGIEPKQRIKLCVDCHTEVHKGAFKKTDAKDTK
ncbi:cysteine dioxygenase [[Actinobacillus] muris]|uniref:Cysteine dioxygenase n=1 Tax=Muribacter muris TaxID=67855 RepID=A0A0J5P4Q2_9PAST|nr:cytochrome c nitrite reductase pentaheme subunit [Muribacter muris]KMK51413.1 cysteine dioxygenase [[Actinobacillus] muris] [Muribacter muris]